MQLPVLTLDMIQKLALMKREQIRLELREQAWLNNMQSELDVEYLMSVSPQTDIVDMHDDIRALRGSLKHELDMHLVLAGFAMEASQQLQPLRMEIAKRLPGARAVGVSANCVAQKVMKLEAAFDDLGLLHDARVETEVQFIPAGPIREPASLESCIEIDTLGFSLRRMEEAWIVTDMECLEVNYNDPEVVDVRLPIEAIREPA